MNSEILSLHSDQQNVFHRSHASMLFTALFGAYLETHDAYIALTWRSPGKNRFRDEYLKDVYFASSLADEFRERQVDTYFAVAPRIVESRKTEAIEHLLTLHVDIDSISLEAENKLKQERPSAIVRSGYGLHGYLFFDEPILASKYGRLTRQLNKRLTQSVGGDMNATDVARILRVPGTFNMKNTANPRLVELIELDSSLRYPLDYLMERYKVSLDDILYGPIEAVSDSEIQERPHYLKADERAYVGMLLENGLMEPGTRNLALMLLVRYYYGEGKSQAETIDLITRFFYEKHNYRSKDWLADPGRCESHIRYAVSSWWKKAYAVQPISAKWHNLSDSDLDFIDSLKLSEWDKVFLIDAMTFIKNCMRDGIIALSTRQLKKFRGANSKNYGRKLYLLLELGIIVPYRMYFKRERKAEEYRVIYEFREGSDEQYSPYRTTAERITELYLSGLSYKEIKNELPGVSRQQIAYHCKRLAQMQQDHQYIEDVDIDYEVLNPTRRNVSPLTKREMWQGRPAEARQVNTAYSPSSIPDSVKK